MQFAGKVTPSSSRKPYVIWNQGLFFIVTWYTNANALGGWWISNISKVVSPQLPSYKAYRVIMGYSSIYNDRKGPPFRCERNHIFEECMVKPQASCSAWLDHDFPKFDNEAHTKFFDKCFVDHAIMDFSCKIVQLKIDHQRWNSTWCESWSTSRRCYPKIHSSW